MKKLVYLFTAVVVFSSCNTRSEYAKEIKVIDSLYNEVDIALTYCQSADSSWAKPMYEEVVANLGEIKNVYTPDSIIKEETEIIGYYKSFKLIGNKFYRDKHLLIRGLKLAKKQLSDLKTDAENSALEPEEFEKYLNNEKLVTYDLLYQFKEFKKLTETVIPKYDSVRPLIEKIIEVYSQIPDEKRNVIKNH